MVRTTKLTLEERFHKHKQQKYKWYLKNKEKVHNTAKMYRYKNAIEKAQNKIFKYQYHLVVCSLIIYFNRRKPLA